MVRYDRTIPPGGVGKITLQVNTRGFHGKITKSARVTTNDPRQRHTKIYLSINVRTHIIVEPGPKIILRGIVGDDVRRVLRIRAADEQPLEITRIDTNLRSVIDYKLTRKDDTNQYNLEVLSKATGLKSASGFLTLHTNHPKKKILKLSVHVRIRPELEVWPKRLAFQKRSMSATGRNQRTQVVTIISNRGKSFRIRELNYNKDYFQVRSLANSDKPARRYQLEVVALFDQLPAGRVGLEDTLIIKTDVAQAAEMKIPLRIQIQRGAGS